MHMYKIIAMKYNIIFINLFHIIRSNSGCEQMRLKRCLS